jgi:phage shock protein A
MTSFLNKLRVVTLGSIHDLLDKEIDLNSPSALRQYVRDLEDALDKMRNEAAVQAGQVRTLDREKGDLEHRIETSKIATTNFLKQGSKDAARVKAAEVVRMTAQVESTTKALEAQKIASQATDSAVVQLEAKHADMVSKVRDLERLDRDTKIKEQSSAAMQSASSLVQGGADISIDDIESKMRARNDVASEKFDRAMGSVKTEEDPSTTAQVDDLLASLQPKDETAAK